jgi:diguanylate cyclase (GGDEF)-like protein
MPALQAHLARQTALANQFFNVVAFDAAGLLVAGIELRDQIGRVNVGDREYFQRTVRQRKAIVSQPLRSALSGKPVVLLTQPVYDGRGNLLFVLAGGIDLEQARFFEHLDKLGPGAAGYLFVLTADGIILHHADQRRILQNVLTEHGGVTAVTHRALAGYEGWSRGMSKAGVDALIGYKRLRHPAWIIGVVYPTREAFAPLREMRQRTLVRTGIAAAFAGVLGLLAIALLLRPLDRLRRNVSRIEKEKADIDILDVDRKDEIGALGRAVHSLTRQRAEARAEMARLLRTDALTGINNRAMVEGELDKALLRGSRSTQRTGVAFLDIDHFKRINDTLGHGAGDRVLVEFAHRLTCAVRAIDTVARYAGDEFLVVFEGLHGTEELDALGEKIAAAIRPPMSIDGAPLAVTTSVGLALAEPGDTRTSLLKRADAALYRVKSDGRDGYHVSGRAPPDSPSARGESGVRIEADGSPGHTG